jgi:hypothetical protein
VANEEGMRALWKGLTPFATHLTLKYALRMGSNSVYQVRLFCLDVRNQQCSMGFGQFVASDSRLVHTAAAAELGFRPSPGSTYLRTNASLPHLWLPTKLRNI